MRMGKKNYAVSNDSKDEGELKYMVAIKEIKAPYTNKQYSFSAHLMRPPPEDQLLRGTVTVYQILTV